MSKVQNSGNQIEKSKPLQDMKRTLGKKSE